MAPGGQRAGVLRCGLAALLFGASTPVAARVADDVSAFTLAGLLYLGAAGAVAPLVAGRGRRDPGTWRRGGGRLAVAVGLGGAAGPLLLMAGLARTPAATASLLLNLELVATVVLAALVFREHIGRRLALGTALVVAASAGLGWSSTPEVRLGALLVAAACLCWGVDNCVTAGLDQLSPAQITFVKGLVAGGANLALGLAVSPVPAAGEVLVALAVGAAGYGASITLWVAGARDLGAARGQLVFATAPFLGAAVAWSAFGEPVTVRQLAAVAVAAVGVGCVLRSDHHHVHQHVPLEHDHEHTHDDGHHDHDHTHDHRVRPVRHADHSDSAADTDDVVHAVDAGVDHAADTDDVAGAEPAGTRSRRRSAHRHRHRHDELVHAHPHVPDLHHHHDHP